MTDYARRCGGNVTRGDGKWEENGIRRNWRKGRKGEVKWEENAFSGRRKNVRIYVSSTVLWTPSWAYLLYKYLTGNFENFIS